MRDNIFTELYNKVMSLFAQPTTIDPNKGVAVNRLKTILMQDRAGFSERSLQMMKEEMLECIAKYMDIDEENFDLRLDAGDNTTILNLSIPVVRAHTDEEVDEIIKKKEEDTQQRAIKMVLELEDLIEEKAKAMSEKAQEEAEEAEESEEEGEEETSENKEEAVEEAVEETEETEAIEEEKEEAEEKKEESTEETEAVEETVEEKQEEVEEVKKEKASKKVKKEEE
ncbi:cell division topological specificity factor MinE [bacterium]|nr:cell division topological specificity factor MinE [bacterium]